MQAPEEEMPRTGLFMEFTAARFGLHTRNVHLIPKLLHGRAIAQAHPGQRRADAQLRFPQLQMGPVRLSTCMFARLRELLANTSENAAIIIQEPWS